MFENTRMRRLLFNKNQSIFLRGRHVVIQVAQKLRRISISKVIIGPNQQSTGMRHFFCLRKVAVLHCMHVVQQPGELPVISCIGDTLHPAHEGKRQHLVPIASLHLLPDDLLFSGRHAGHHVGKIRRGEQEEMLYSWIVVPGQIVDDLVRTEIMTGENVMGISFLRGKCQICVDILIRLGKTLVP